MTPGKAWALVAKMDAMTTVVALTVCDQCGSEVTEVVMDEEVDETLCTACFLENSE